MVAASCSAASEIEANWESNVSLRNGVCHFALKAMRGGDVEMEGMVSLMFVDIGCM